MARLKKHAALMVDNRTVKFDFYAGEILEIVSDYKTRKGTHFFKLTDGFRTIYIEKTKIEIL